MGLLARMQTLPITLEMTLMSFPFPCFVFLCVCRDSVEDPLDDTGTVQQQLDQVTSLF